MAVMPTRPPLAQAGGCQAALAEQPRAAAAGGPRALSPPADPHPSYKLGYYG